MKHSLKLFLPLLVFFIATSSTCAQPPQAASAEPVPPQHRMMRDPIRQLNLTPEQREQIRAIREQNRAEQAAINTRVFEANRALEQVLDSDNPDEAVIEQHTKALAAAQAESMRMRILREVRIRRVLTSEQRNILRTLRQQAQEARRERRLIRPGDRQRRREQRTFRMQNQRDSLGPVFPRPEAQRSPRP